MTWYAVTREPGPEWDRSLPMRAQPMWDEHAEFMDSLVNDGFVLFGGPLGDGSQVLLIVRAGTEAYVEARLAEDPWTPMGLLRTAKIEPWEILLGEPGD
jgi:uncharacterized protein YciI